MPRDVGTGIYNYPDGTPGNPGQTVFSTRYNTFINDLKNSLNQKLPINMGGTGADDAAEARDNIDAERAGQQVTNYDSHSFEYGSFYSLDTATSPPVGGHAFAGIVYGIGAGPIPDTIVIEARDLTNGLLYVRQKSSLGVWGAWVGEGDAYVNVTGDTMSGDLAIAKFTPALTLNGFGNVAKNIYGQRDGVARWLVQFGDGTAADDFIIARHNDAGVIQGSPVQISRATGNLTLTGSFLNDLTIAKASPTLTLQAAGNTPKNISAKKDTLQHWLMQLGDGTAADDFLLARYNDAGTIQSIPITCYRANGNVMLAHGLGVSGTTVGSNPGIGNTIVGAEMGAGYIITNRAGAASAYHGVVGDGVCVQFNRGGAVVGTIAVTATATAYNTSSDERLKTDLKSFDAAAIIDDTNVYDFKWKSTGERSYGIIAQQAKDVYPAAVTYDKETDRWFADYSKYVPVILQELQSLRARVAELEGRLGAGAQPA